MTGVSKDTIHLTIQLDEIVDRIAEVKIIRGDQKESVPFIEKLCGAISSTLLQFKHVVAVSSKVEKSVNENCGHQWHYWLSDHDHVKYNWCIYRNCEKCDQTQRKYLHDFNKERWDD